jgi:hypothetical protein
LRPPRPQVFTNTPLRPVRLPALFYASPQGGSPAIPWHINIVLRCSRGASTPLRSRPSTARCDSARRNLHLAPYAAAWNPPLRPPHRVVANPFAPPASCPSCQAGGTPGSAFRTGVGCARLCGRFQACVPTAGRRRRPCVWRGCRSRRCRRCRESRP